VSGHWLKYPAQAPVVRLSLAAPVMPIWLELDEVQFTQFVAFVPAVIGVAAPLHTPFHPK
jgi:hypothetical protein